MRQYNFKPDFVKNAISGPAAQFFVFIPKLFFTTIFEIKIHEKIPWHQKNSNSKAAFHKSRYIQIKVNKNCSLAQLAKWLSAIPLCYPREFNPSFRQSFFFQKESDSNVTQFYRSLMMWRCQTYNKVTKN